MAPGEESPKTTNGSPTKGKSKRIILQKITQRVAAIKKDTKSESRQQCELEDMEVAYKHCGETGPARIEAKQEPDPGNDWDILRSALESAFAGLGGTRSEGNDSRLGIKVHGVLTSRYMQ
ncbi:hypothetical protein Y032_0152g2894 [Ancylostoma ceylanicum]|nr:hypothetical protein Y032_0152g2894 [Ancylostoma ceylanicum]